MWPFKRKPKKPNKIKVYVEITHIEFLNPEVTYDLKEGIEYELCSYGLSIRDAIEHKLFQKSGNTYCLH